MNRIDGVFAVLRKKGKKALIPYVACGDPDIKFTEKLVSVLADSGADMVELGIPYSDPVADGPTIQKASVRALKGGVTLENIFALAGRLRKKVDIPLIIMTYYNPVYVMGAENFVKKAAAAGVDGLIIPDLPLEEAYQLKTLADNNGINLIFLVAPTSTKERIQKISHVARGFIYCVSVAGVTGARQKVSNSLEGFLNRIRTQTSLPLVVGFGISSPDTAQKAAQHADGVIVGSALIERIEKNINDSRHALKTASDFIRELKKAIANCKLQKSCRN